VSASLRLRFGLAPLLVLALFLGLTGLVVERSYRQAVEQGEHEVLLARVYTLLAVAELGADGRLQLPEHLPEARLSNPGSGLYARVFDGNARLSWQSRSTLGQTLPALDPVGVGETRFRHLPRQPGPGLFQLGFGVEWEDDHGKLWPFVLQISESDQGYQVQLGSFGRTLWSGLAGVALALLLVQGLVLAWGLRPLRQVADDLEQIRQGGRNALQGPYPKELQPFTDSIDRFIVHERSARDRYRDRLAELAHSLKTPLAVLKTVLERGPDAPDRATLIEQLQRMDDIVAYQLGRAATAGRSPLAVAVAIRPLAERLSKALDKVYHGRGIDCRVDIPADLEFRGDGGDLMELLGNLMDNAYKWAAGQVRCSARPGPDTSLASAGEGVGEVAGQGIGLSLWIEDDGPGIGRADQERLKQRGQRGDTSVNGQGIGLAAAQDIVAVYGGRLALQNSELGGLRVEVYLPSTP
jgi:two-component system sensor histidine kinase PhoQ